MKSKLELRKKLISNKYKIEDYEGAKKILEGIYKKEVAEKLVEYLIKNDMQLSSVSDDEKNKILTDILADKGAKDVEITKDSESTTFAFYAQPKEAKLNEPVKVILIFRNGQENNGPETSSPTAY